MNFNELLLILLLIITFILLIFHFFINICDLSIKEPFSVEVGSNNCLFEFDKSFPPIPDIITDNKISSDYNHADKDYKYHSDYTCQNIIGNETDNTYNNRQEIILKNLLLHYKCINKSPYDVKSELLKLGYDESNFIFSSDKNCMIGKNNRLEEKVINLMNNRQYKGPVYIIIAQANKIKNIDAQKEYMTKGSYINNYQSCTYNNDICSNDVKCEMLIIFTDGNKEKIVALINYINSNKSNDNTLCNIVCHNDSNEDSVCGCLNLKNSYEFNNIKRDSKCLVIEDGKAIQRDFSIVYFVNPHNNNNIIINKWEW